MVLADIGYGEIEPFRDTFPERYYNVGVAEQNMTGVACGIAMEGNIAVTYSIANFPTLRCLEQIRNDVCYHDANVKIVIIGGGVSKEGEYLTDKVKAYCEKYAYGYPGSLIPKIFTAKLGNDAGLIGAAALFMQD